VHQELAVDRRQSLQNIGPLASSSRMRRNARTMNMPHLNSARTIETLAAIEGSMFSEGPGKFTAATVGAT